MEAWKGFKNGKWKQEIDVRNFIQTNYTPYEGDGSFLKDATDRTKKLWLKISELLKEEHKNGILDAETKIPSSITAYGAGYIDKELEIIKGLQTDKPLKRAIMPFGGLRVVKKALESYGYTLSKETEEIFSKYRKTHNNGVFDAYNSEIKKARHSGIITGLPDAYGRGRIIGDYRRVPLYGVNKLIEEKQHELDIFNPPEYDSETINVREQISEGIKSLKELIELGNIYNCDLTRPAENAEEAIQWLYLAFLGAVKEQDGAAMSLGRTSTFLDVYIQRDLENGKIDEKKAQELMDDFVIKLRIIRFLRTPEYNALFSGDPTWVTESIGGMGIDGRTLVTKNSFRILNTLNTLGPAPEPNMTVLWSTRLPKGFKDFCCETSINTSSVQYENDDLMLPYWGDDYAIACCVSAMRIGKQMQFFGARANLAKALLYAINGGRDEKTGEQVAPRFEPVTSEYLDYDEVMEKYKQVLEWLSGIYMNSLNIIHFMHDKYNYEKLQMALHDREILRTQACGIAGLSVAADSLSAIKNAKVKVIRDDTGLAVDYEIEGDYPAFGNNDDSVDDIAYLIVKTFMEKLKNRLPYRNSKTTLSILTITSNVVYGKKTGSTPDGRKSGEPFAPGANPMHARDKKGALASLSSVAKLPYEYAQDGISYTFSIIPGALGKNMSERKSNLSGMMDGFFSQSGHHLNINVFDRETLIDAMEHPEKYPQLTVRVSGYAVNFIKLTKEQQLDVINRTFHEVF